MYYGAVFIGILIGLILFLFLFVIGKKSGHYYLAPLITFFLAVLVIGYNVLSFRTIQGIDYGLVGIGLLIVAVMSALLLPAKLKDADKRIWNKFDIIGLVALPCLLLLAIGFLFHLDQNPPAEKGDSKHQVADARTLTP